jgi:membrane protease YdiL (CAAX protease family)
MYIEQVQKNLSDWWRYLIGLVIAVSGVFVFSIPHGAALIAKIATGDVDMDKIAANDTAYLMGMFEPNLNFLYILLPFTGGLIFLYIAVRLLHKQTITNLTTSRSKIDWKRVFLAFLLWGFISTSITLIDISMSPEDYVYNFEFDRFIILAAIAILLVPLQTSFEEYMFRGYFMQGIGNLVRNKFVPLIITSVAFGLLHLSNPEVDKLGNIIMIYYIGTGFFLGIITLMDEGMELALGFHAANNLFTALLVTADWTAFQTHSVYKSIADPASMGVNEIIVPVFVIFPILLLIFSKIYNWNNWYDKLAGPVREISTTDEA